MRFCGKAIANLVIRTDMSGHCYAKGVFKPKCKLIAAIEFQILYQPWPIWVVPVTAQWGRLDSCRIPI